MYCRYEQRKRGSPCGTSGKTPGCPQPGGKGEETPSSRKIGGERSASIPKPPCKEKPPSLQTCPPPPKAKPEESRPMGTSGGGSFGAGTFPGIGGAGVFPGLRGVGPLSGKNEGELMALLILLLLLWEGREDAGGTILTLLLFFIL